MLTGTRSLLKVTLGQDARNIAPWVMLISALSASSVLAYAWIFPDATDRIALSRTLGVNPALSLVFGPARDLMSADGFNAWRAGQLGALFAGLMAILIVVRNSRAHEDSGQAELIASGVIARESRLAVAVALASLASIVLGVVSFALTVLCGGDVLATLLLAGTFTASGLMFTGVASITSQLGADARTASSLAIGILGLGFVMRGYFDTNGSDDQTAWLTPFGWLEKVGPSTDNNPWPLLLALGFAILLVVVGFVLLGRRDFGQGLIAVRPGPATAGVAGTVWGLELKANRTSLCCWLVAFAGLGFIFGNLASSVSEVIAGNPAIAAVLAAGAEGASGFTFAFLATILQLIAILAAVLGAQLILRVRDEEIGFRVEPLLAGSLRRSVYLASNVVLGLAVTAVAMLLAGVGVALVATGKDDALSFAELVLQAVATIPAVWLLVGLAVAAVGAAPSIRFVSWAAIVATFILTILGPLFKLPAWALDISPLRHVPNVSLSSPDWAGLAWLGALTLVLLAIGFAGFRRRDIL